MLKKRLKNNIDISLQKGGPGRVAEIVDEYNQYSTDLPQPIYMEDIEGGVMDVFQTGEFAMSIDNRQVPVIYLTNERWGDFAKTWEYNDGDKNVVPPYILIERGRIQKGTYYEGRYNTPVKNYLYYKKPTFENGLYGYDLYKIPEPSALDIDYKISFVSRYIQDTNTFIEHILDKFKGLEYYITVNGHYFRMLRDVEFSDDGTTTDRNADRYYVITTKINLRAYILSEKDFTVTKAYNRLRTNTKII